jgi:hypothetical protein
MRKKEHIDGYINISGYRGLTGVLDKRTNNKHG